MVRKNATELKESIPISRARDILNTLPDLLSEDYRAIALTRHGKPVLAVMTWELYEAIAETLEVMADEELLSALRRGIKEAAEGKVTPWEAVKTELGL